MTLILKFKDQQLKMWRMVRTQTVLEGGERANKRAKIRAKWSSKKNKAVKPVATVCYKKTDKC
jgi:hypothetical protein